MGSDLSSWIRPLRHRSNPHEILDEGDHPEDELFGTFEDMRRVNNWLGGTSITLKAVTRLAGQLNAGDKVTILDVGTGHADIPRAIVSHCSQKKLIAKAIGLDIDHATLRTAKSHPDNTDIRFVVGDNLNLPFPDDAVDITMSSMTLHHLNDENAVRALSEMARVSRIGIIINDLTRTVHGYAVAWILGRIATSNRLTRHDAHRSIQRGRTEEELAHLAHRAGLQAPVFDSTLGYRTAMTVGVRPWG